MAPNRRLRGSIEIPSELTLEQVHAARDYFFQQAHDEFGDIVSMTDRLELFRHGSLLEAGTIGEPNLDSARELGSRLILNYTEEAIRTNYDTQPKLRDKLLRLGPASEMFIPYGDVLREARQMGPVVFMGNHPTFATPEYQKVDATAVFGNDSLKEQYTVVGPFVASFEIFGLDPIEIINTSNVILTAPSGKLRGDPDRSVSMFFWAENYKQEIKKVLNEGPNENGDYNILHIMPSGTRDKSPLWLPTHKKGVKAASRGTIDTVIQPGVTYVVSGIDDHLFDPEFGAVGDIRSPLYRKVRIFHVAENPDPERRFARDKPLIVYDLEDESFPHLEMSAADAMAFMQKKSVQLANAAAVEAGSRSKYIYNPVPNAA